MKTFRKVLLFLAFLPGGLFFYDLSADPPTDPPPPPGGGHGTENNQTPAGAPIDGGLGILFVLGTFIAGIKSYHNRTGCKGNK
jgi:hypothetical protein